MTKAQRETKLAALDALRRFAESRASLGMGEDAAQDMALAGMVCDAMADTTTELAMLQAVV